jgi:hypothetical protein
MKHALVTALIVAGTPRRAKKSAAPPQRHTVLHRQGNIPSLQAVVNIEKS